MWYDKVCCCVSLSETKSAMFPRIVFIIFAVNFISFGRGDEPQLDREDFVQILECVGKALPDRPGKILGESHETIDDKIRLTYLFLKVREGSIESYGKSASKVNSFFNLV